MHTTGPRDAPFDLAGLAAPSAAVFGAFMRAGRLHRLLMLRVLAEQRVPPGQAFGLRILAAHEGATQRELGDMLHLAAPTVTAMLKRMERSGTITREPDPADQRVTRVRLTPAGRDLERRLSTVLACRIGQLLDSMPEADRRDLARLLDDLAGRMAREIDEPPTDPGPGSPGIGRGRRGSDPMIRLLATYLRPYRGPLALVVALLLVQSLANLYLPELNADIVTTGLPRATPTTSCARAR